MNMALDPKTSTQPSSNSRSLGEALLAQGWLTAKQLTDALQEQKRTGQKLGQILLDNNFVSDEQIAKVLANAQMTSVATKPNTASCVSSKTNLGNTGAHKVAATLPTTKPITPKPSACCTIMLAMVMLRAVSLA